MQEHPDRTDAVTELELRLADWRPATAGLSPDQVLFAAGRVAGRTGRNLGWVVSGCLMVLMLVLGPSFRFEREARLQLLAQLQDLRRVIDAVPRPPFEEGESPSSNPPRASSYLTARNAMIHDIDRWSEHVTTEPAPAPPVPSRPILKSHSLGEMIEP
jgi:hypothetical protein